MTWRLSDETLAALGEKVVAGSGGLIGGYAVAIGELTVTARAETIVEALAWLRDEPATQFHQLMDVCAAVYHLLSMTRNHRIRVKVQTDEDTAVPSVVTVFPGAEWFEREAFDMYGVFFSGHPDLRRLLTDYGFHGHPLRKDFPMTGYVEVRYDDELKRVIYEPVKSVEFRNWDFLSPWEGAAYAKPGHDPSGDAKTGKAP
jgi:NADH-quinone oxidoreductase subunit C